MKTSLSALLAAAVALVPMIASAVPERPSANATEALARLKSNTAGEIKRNARADAAYTMLRANGARPLMADSGAQAPAERAQFFLSIYGAALGVDDPVAQLEPGRVSTDRGGGKHVHLAQTHAGLPVFGARLVVHMNDAGITGASGVFVRGLDRVPLVATRDLSALRAGALGYAGKLHRGARLSIESGRLLIYPVGLIQSHVQEPRLAYEAIVGNGADVRERIFVDARNGQILDRINEVRHVRNREIYHGDMTVPPTLTEGLITAPADPALIPDPGHGSDNVSGPAPGVPEDNLYVFAGGTYALYKNLFGREGYDACDGTPPCESGTAPAWTPLRGNDNLTFAGQIQQSVYLISSACPNAYWNGKSTNYCPGFDADDVVSHEWSHAYTEYTSNLVYAYQSGALNESYSDIFGESYDLVNNIEGPLGPATLDENLYYEEGGSRWVVGEDLSEEAALLLLRDMWKPEDFNGTPGRAFSGVYVCGSGDGGGVHTNSSVPNHAYAMLVDGTAGQGPEGTTGFERDSYNGQSFTGIGMVKAANIYWQAQASYQTETTDFPQHADYLRAACEDLKGAALTDILGNPSAEVITSADCAKVNQALLATEMDLGTLCPYLQVLKPDGEPALCAGAQSIFSEDWEDGDTGWTKTSTGVFPEWNDASRPERDFRLTTALPMSHPSGTAAFAKNVPIGESGGGSCTPGGDYSGAFTYDSPDIAIPAGAEDLDLRFDHYVNTEATADGGQLEIAVNGGAFTLVAQEDYLYNFPNSTLLGPADLSNNPDGGEFAWNGADINAPSGSPPANWGTTVVNLNAFAAAGDTVKLRFKFAQEGCNGRDGWYVDDIKVSSCAVLEAPVLSAGTDYENPDTDGTFTLNWTRPDGATGPDQVQVSEASCAPILTDDAETDLSKWVVTTEGDGAQAWDQSGTKVHGGANSFFATYSNGSDAAQLGNVPAMILTLKDAVAIPVAGETALNYFEWVVHEGDDSIFVEVSTDGGATWAVLRQDQRFMGPEEAAPLLVSEPMAERSHSLAAYKGQSVKVRFRLQSGGEDRPASSPFGWYLDDIAIVNDNWADIASTAATTRTLVGQAVGSRCYRVRSTYTIAGNPAVGPYRRSVPTATSCRSSCRPRTVAAVVVAAAVAVAIPPATTPWAAGFQR
jgi:bacillolysin